MGRHSNSGSAPGGLRCRWSARGVRVVGIDLSDAMVARLRAKPGSEDVEVVIGDFATVQVEEVFSLAYVVFNTLMNLGTQEAQVACFRNVGRHLVSGGCFVCEVMLPELRRLAPGERFLPFEVSPEHLGFDEYETVRQCLTSHHYYPAEGGYSTFPAATSGQPNST